MINDDREPLRERLMAGDPTMPITRFGRHELIYCIEVLRARIKAQEDSMGSSAEDLTKAIGEAKKSGDTALAKKLEDKLDKVLDGIPERQPVTEPAPPGQGNWIDEVDGLGSIKVPASDIPVRSSREIALVNDYFNEGTQNYLDDEQRLHDMLDGAEEIPE